jgi:hypothetical protein
MSTKREEFETIFSKPPYEFDMARFDALSAWPGNYRDYHCQCAWDGWQEARAALASAPATPAIPSAQPAPSSGLAPCPFCSHTAAPKPWTYREMVGEDYWDDGNADSFAVVCDAEKPDGPGGCGGSGGFFPTEEAAIAAWNRRPAAPAATQPTCKPGLPVATQPTDAHIDLAHELWAAAQLAPGEGIADGAERVAAILATQQAGEEAADPIGAEVLRQTLKYADASIVQKDGEIAVLRREIRALRRHNTKLADAAARAAQAKEG